VAVLVGLSGVLAASCGGGSSRSSGRPLSLSALAVQPPKGYQVRSHYVNGVPTGTQTIAEAGVSASSQESSRLRSALRQCGWRAGELQYWTNSAFDDVTIRVNEFPDNRGALCYQSSLNAQSLPAGVTRSTVATFPAAWEISTQNLRNPPLDYFEITFVQGVYAVQVVDSGRWYNPAVTAGVAKKQQLLLP